MWLHLFYFYYLYSIILILHFYIIHNICVFVYLRPIIWYTVHTKKWCVPDMNYGHPTLMCIPSEYPRLKLLVLSYTVFIRLIRARTIRKRQKNWAARGYLSARLIKWCMLRSHLYSNNTRALEGPKLNFFWFPALVWLSDIILYLQST